MKNRTTIRIAVKEARHHLEALVRDSRQIDAHEKTRITRIEIAAIDVSLAELHRLNVVVAAQAKLIFLMEDHGTAKPAGARSPAPAARGTTANQPKRKQLKK